MNPSYKKNVFIQNFAHFARGGSIPKMRHETSLSFNTLEIRVVSGRGGTEVIHVQCCQ